MSAPLRRKNSPLTTRAAEGLERRRFSVAEIEAMVQAGVIEEDERFELIGGEVVPMSPKGARVTSGSRTNSTASSSAPPPTI
jgi:hypothetical protein